MAKPLPSDLFPGYELLAAAGAATVESIAIPVSSLVGLTAAEVNETTGDGRELLYSLLTTAHEELTTLPTPPSRLQISRGEAITGDTTRRIDFNVSFYVTVPYSAYVLQAEPA